ncbi:efflux RND transporter periplasmic adaptor subunit [Sphingomonas mali]|uniref:efflux RND transporter periplasmic adaptor subunit n=1 Tax=Sphingomonas mali TaxID=40682 RepID=UPI000829D6B9|nr:efflux RND transporter periplasmic adaptor subunit [Sphingomonas mali]
MPSEEQVEEPAPRGPKGLKIAGIVATVIAVGTVAMGVTGRMGDTAIAQRWSDARSIPAVHLVGVTHDAASAPLALPATMEAWNAAKLYARVGGYVKAWYRDIGAHVGAGTPLGLIDTPELDQQIDQARAALASAVADQRLARSTAARWNDLLSTNSVSQQEADEKNGSLAAKTALVDAAKANLGRLLALKSFATLRAPFAGVVTTRAADIGDLVGPGATAQQPLFAVADVGRIRIYVSVPQAYSSAIRDGLSATLTVPDYPGRTFPAHVVGDSGAIDTQSGTFQVQLVADNPGEVLRPGGYAQVRFDVPIQGGGVQIPSSALVFRAQGTQVALVDAGAHVRLRHVTIGRDLGQTVEIVSGLHAGDRVVDNPPDSISDGELVRLEGRHA